MSPHAVLSPVRWSTVCPLPVVQRRPTSPADGTKPAAAALETAAAARRRVAAAPPVGVSTYSLDPPPSRAILASCADCTGREWRWGAVDQTRKGGRRRRSFGQEQLAAALSGGNKKTTRSRARKKMTVPSLLREVQHLPCPSPRARGASCPLVERRRGGKGGRALRQQVGACAPPTTAPRRHQEKPQSRAITLAAGIRRRTVRLVSYDRDDRRRTKWTRKGHHMTSALRRSSTTKACLRSRDGPRAVFAAPCRLPLFEALATCGAGVGRWEAWGASSERVGGEVLRGRQQQEERSVARTPVSPSSSLPLRSPAPLDMAFG